MAQHTAKRARARTEYLDADGREKPDPKPLSAALGYKRQESMAERIRGMVRSEHLRIAAEQQGFETFEESDDFEIDDDPEAWASPYEEHFEPEPEPDEGEDTERIRAILKALKSIEDIGAAEKPQPEPPSVPPKA